MVAPLRFFVGISAKERRLNQNDGVHKYTRILHIFNVVPSRKFCAQKYKMLQITILTQIGKYPILHICARAPDELLRSWKIFLFYSGFYAHAVCHIILSIIRICSSQYPSMYSNFSGVASISTVLLVSSGVLAMLLRVLLVHFHLLK